AVVQSPRAPQLFASEAMRDPQATSRSPPGRNPVSAAAGSRTLQTAIRSESPSPGYSSLSVEPLVSHWSLMNFSHPAPSSWNESRTFSRFPAVCLPNREEAQLSAQSDPRAFAAAEPWAVEPKG